MDYRQGTTGRIFSIRFDDGDDFLEELLGIIRKENIRQGWFQVIGGLRQAEFVTGPKEPVMPPEPVWDSVDGARETLGNLPLGAALATGQLVLWALVARAHGWLRKSHVG